MEIGEKTVSSKIHGRHYVKKFKDLKFMEKHLSPEIESVEESMLPEYLSYFYSSLRRYLSGNMQIFHFSTYQYDLMI